MAKSLVEEFQNQVFSNQQCKAGGKCLKQSLSNHGKQKTIITTPSQSLSSSSWAEVSSVLQYGLRTTCAMILYP